MHHKKPFAGRKSQAEEEPKAVIPAFMKHRYFVFQLMLVGLALFFTDMKQERGSPVRQLYGLAHMGFFALTAPVLSRLLSLARRPFSFQ